ncbi:MAG: prolyl oligopeptidase family serine peptidase [Lentisphaeraceae bacterium]|nr:prolyl oligopeptidase family serine peptidase [Lentisphaeraceae bacterium]
MNLLKCCVAVLFFISPYSQGETIQVIIQSGQSNSDGRADNKGVPPETLKFASKVLFYHGNASGNAHTSCPDKKLITVMPGSGSLHKGKNHFGPEISMAADIQQAYPNQKFAIIKYAKGGSSLFTDWHLKTGPHLTKLRKTVEAGLKALENAGYEPEIRAFIWHQGESDSKKERAPLYAEKIEAFLKQMRHDFNSTMAIAVGQINTKQKLDKALAEQVIAGQIAVTKKLSKTYTFTTDDLSLKNDQMHYDTEGMLGLGKKYAEVLLPHLKAREKTQLWPDGRVPGDWLQKNKETTVRSKGTSRKRYTQVPTMTFYPTNEVNRPSVVICPGGGYNILAYDKEGEEVAEWLNSQGYNAFVLKYRLPLKGELPRHRPALQDAQRAISLIRSQKETLGISDQIGIMGFSAGGHLTVMTSTSTERTYAAIDEADKLSHMPNFSIPVYPAYLSKDGTLVDMIKVTDKTPTTFIMHAVDDVKYFPNSPVYLKALKDKGIPAHFAKYQTGGHGHGIRITGKEADAWIQELAKWLKEVAP